MYIFCSVHEAKPCQPAALNHVKLAGIAIRLFGLANGKVEPVSSLQGLEACFVVVDLTLCRVRQKDKNFMKKMFGLMGSLRPKLTIDPLPGGPAVETTLWRVILARNLTL